MTALVLTLKVCVLKAALFHAFLLSIIDSWVILSGPLEIPESPEICQLILTRPIRPSM